MPGRGSVERDDVRPGRMYSGSCRIGIGRCFDPKSQSVGLATVGNCCVETRGSRLCKRHDGSALKRGRPWQLGNLGGTTRAGHCLREREEGKEGTNERADGGMHRVCGVGEGAGAAVYLMCAQEKPISDGVFGCTGVNQQATQTLPCAHCVHPVSTATFVLKYPNAYVASISSNSTIMSKTSDQLRVCSHFMSTLKSNRSKLSSTILDGTPQLR